MRDLIFPVQHDSETGLQVQLRRQLVEAILDGRLTAEDPLPSCRRMAQSLGVSRNTVVLAYQALTDEGLLISRERVGYFVNPEAAAAHVDPPAMPEPEGLPDASPGDTAAPIDWWRHFKIHPSEQAHITKPKSWRHYPYPFIYGQADPGLFPVAAWRLCSRQALALQAIAAWSEDSFGEDDPLLIEEVRARVLPRRGIKASPSQILITLGAQNALSLVAQLLADSGTTIGLEEPGYVDARNIFALSGARVVPLPVDAEGLLVDKQVEHCDCVYVTPSHQSPTTVTMPLARRHELLRAADKHGIFVIEDDYEAEINYISHPTPALKSIDRSQRIIYVGSFSKYLAPGLRIGYLVAAEPLIHEARQLRRLILRQPPTNNQRTVGLFIANGYYDTLVSRLQRAYRSRWLIMGEALADFLPDCRVRPSMGGTSFWIEGPDHLDADVLARSALARGVVIEPGSIHFQAAKPPRNCFRLGFSSIAEDKIRPGIQLLAELMQEAV
ncbi:MAG: PLP-dependent aminotransferase family protein [Kiloniellales bacterium]